MSDSPTTDCDPPCSGCGAADADVYWQQPDGRFCIDCVVGRSYRVPDLTARVAQAEAAKAAADKKLADIKALLGS